MSRTVKPHGEWILVELDKPIDRTEDGVIILDIHKIDVHTWATVRAVGNGRVTKKGAVIPNDVEVGDRVYFVYFLVKTESNKQIAHSLPNNHYLIKNDDILCIEKKQTELAAG